MAEVDASLRTHDARSRRPIASAALDARKAFRAALNSLPGEKPSLKAEYVPADLEDDFEQFQAWSSNLGVLTKERASLDARLRHLVLVSNTIVELLESITENLTRATKLAHSDKDPDVLYEALEGGYDSDDNLLEEDELEEAITHAFTACLSNVNEDVRTLNGLAARIRRSGAASRASKAAKYVPSDPATRMSREAFKERYLLAVLSREGVQEPLKSRLREAIAARRQLFEYSRDHKSKLAHDEFNPPSDWESDLRGFDVVEAKPPPDHTAEPLLSPTVGRVNSFPLSAWGHSEVDVEAFNTVPAPTIQGPSRRLQAGTDKQAFLFPPPPKLSARAADFICPHCDETLPRSKAEWQAWKRHLVRDLRPYVCIFASCEASGTEFQNEIEWHEHQRQHVTEWWCDGDKKAHSRRRFTSLREFETHVSAEHKNTPRTGDDLKLTSKYAARPSDTVYTTCPFCDFLPQGADGQGSRQRNRSSISGDLKSDSTFQSRLREHILVHLYGFFSLALILDTEGQGSAKSWVKTSAKHSSKLVFADEEDDGRLHSAGKSSGIGEGDNKARALGSVNDQTPQAFVEHFEAPPTPPDCDEDEMHIILKMMDEDPRTFRHKLRTQALNSLTDKQLGAKDPNTRPSRTLAARQPEPQPAHGGTEWAIDSSSAAMADIGADQSMLHKPPEKASNESIANETARLLLGSLNSDASDLYGVRDSKPKYLDGTCEWIIDTPQYNTFLHAKTPEALTLVAHAGKGKSMIAKFIARQLRSRSEDTVLEFYCSAGLGNITAATMIAALICQILQSQPKLSREFNIFRARSIDSEQQPSFEALWDVFTSLLKCQTCPEVACVLDGLDECLPEVQKAIVSAIDNSLQSDRSTKTESGTKIRYFITSRFTPWILDFGERTGLIEIGESDVAKDLEKYVTQQLTAILPLKVDSTNTTDAKILVDSLAAQILLDSEGSFLHATLALNDLENSNIVSDSSIAEVIKRKRLRSVEDIYAADLERQSQDEPSKCSVDRILEILLYSFEELSPIQLSEAVEALNSDFGVGERTVSHEKTPLLSETDIKAICGSLVKIVNGRLRFYHHTVRDFLLSSQFSSRYDAIACHEQLATVCVKWLTLPTSLFGGDAEPRILEYAMDNWAKHFREIQSVSSSAFGLASKLLAQPNWSWKSFIKKQGRYGEYDPDVEVMSNETKLFILATEDLSSILVQSSGFPKMRSEQNSSNSTTPATNALASELNVGENVNAQNNSLETPLMLAAFNSALGSVKFLLENGADVNMRNESDRTALHSAVTADSQSTIHELLGYGANIEAADSNGKTPFILASTISTARLLLDRGANIDACTNLGRTSLSFACSEGNLTLVRELLSRGANLSHRESDGHNILYYAAGCGNLDLVEFLLSLGVPMTTDDNGFAPLHNAAQQGVLEIVRALLARGAEVNGSSKKGSTPLACAIREDHHEVVECLLKAGASTTTVDIEGENALIEAARVGNVETVKLLAPLTPDLDFQNNRGYTAFALACAAGRLEVVRFLIDEKASMVTGPDCVPALQMAIYNSHTEVAQLLIDSGADINELFGDTFTPLHTAAVQKNEEISKKLLSLNAKDNEAGENVQKAMHLFAEEANRTFLTKLLERGDDPNCRTGRGWTPLHYAARSGFVGVIQDLLSFGADIEAVDIKKWTALHFSCRYGTVESTRLLIENGASLEALTEDNLTPFILSAASSQIEMVRLMVDSGSDVSAQSRVGESALHIAAEQGHTEVTKFLAELAVDIEDQDKSGATPFLMAMRRHQWKVAQLLLDMGADPTVKDTNDFSALHQAARGGHEELVGTLLAANLSALDTSKWGYTPMQLAAVGGHTAVVEKLLATTDGVIDPENSELKALSRAARGGHLETVKLLLRSGARVKDSTEDAFVKHPVLTHAAESGNLEVVETLLEHGADPATASGLGETALLDACRRGNLKMAEKLLDKGAPVNATAMFAVTPLSVAVVKRNENLVELLLTHGADAQHITGEGLNLATLSSEFAPVCKRIKNASGFRVQPRTEVDALLLASTKQYLEELEKVKHENQHIGLEYLEQITSNLIAMREHDLAETGLRLTLRDDTWHYYSWSPRCDQCGEIIQDMDEPTTYVCKICPWTVLCHECFSKYDDETRPENHRICSGHSFLTSSNQLWWDMNPRIMDAAEKEAAVEAAWLERLRARISELEQEDSSEDSDT